MQIGLNARYKGEESGTFWVDASYKVLGPGGNTYDDRCGVIPNDITNAGETFAAAAVEGSVCFSVDTEQVDGATLIVEESFSFSDQARKFFALK